MLSSDMLTDICNPLIANYLIPPVVAVFCGRPSGVNAAAHDHYITIVNEGAASLKTYNIFG